VIDKRFGDGDGVHNHQFANCFVEGLSVTPFHYFNNGKDPVECASPAGLEWIALLEGNFNVVKQELHSYLSDFNNKNNERDWLGPRNTNAEGYGPGWKTLGLQDRGLWDENNDFPLTCKLLTDIHAPTCEVFFARQG
jgi:hypothetical protein